MNNFMFQNVLNLIGLNFSTGLKKLKMDEIEIQFHRFRHRSRKNEISDISPGAKVCYSNKNVRFENCMHVEWSEEKFLKSIVGDKMRLSF